LCSSEPCAGIATQEDGLCNGCREAHARTRAVREILDMIDEEATP
jgi:hypothetical protein